MPIIETMAMQRFMETVKRAAQSHARDIRLDIADATILATEIGSLLARLAALENNRPVVPTASMDGGSLR